MLEFGVKGRRVVFHVSGDSCFDFFSFLMNLKLINMVYLCSHQRIPQSEEKIVKNISASNRSHINVISPQDPLVLYWLQSGGPDRNWEFYLYLFYQFSVQIPCNVKVSSEYPKLRLSNLSLGKLLSLLSI